MTLAHTHPLTGVSLNPILIRRKSLDLDEAKTAVILRQTGTPYNDVAHLLGVNPARIGEVLRGEVHPEARMLALRLLTR